MPRVAIQKKSSRGKEIKCSRPGCGEVIKEGETYYKWSFFRGMTYTNCHLHRPRNSELTQSLLGTIYAAVEDLEDTIDTESTYDEIRDAVQMVADATQEVIDQYTEAAENFGGAGENQERADELEGWLNELENFDIYEPSGDEDEEELEAMKETAVNEAMDIVNTCPL